MACDVRCRGDGVRILLWVRATKTRAAESWVYDRTAALQDAFAKQCSVE